MSSWRQAISCIVPGIFKDMGWLVLFCCLACLLSCVLFRFILVSPRCPVGAGRLGRTLWPQNSTSVAETKRGSKFYNDTPPPPPTLEKGGQYSTSVWKVCIKRGSKIYNSKQGKSEGFESCDRPIVRKRPICVKIGDVLSRVTLKFDGWP